MKEPVRDIVICDLDGTLAIDDHRAVHLHKNPHCPKQTDLSAKCFCKPEERDWDTYFSLCGEDTPNHAVVQLIRILNHARKRIFIFSGRSDAVRSATVEWLDRYNIVYERLEMRRADSRTDDNVLKLSWVDSLGIRDRIWLVLEDRSRVVAAWRDAGYTCLQVRPGEF